MSLARILGLSLILTAPAFAQTTTVSIEPDMRDCIYPVCGGWWVARTNHRLLRCVDGTMREQCYVSEIDWSTLSLRPDQEDALVREAYQSRVLLRTRVGTVTYPGFPERFGILLPEAAWVRFP